MKVGAVDIGTNSMRLLITDGDRSIRRVVVTGLGRGVDKTGRLQDEAITRTLETLKDFGRLLDSNDVRVRRAIATSASRDASNREFFFDETEKALGVRPTLISGEEEASLALAGARSGVHLDDIVVSDIGGGSTELVSANFAISVDIGSVRLSERHLPDRPATDEQIRAASEHCRSLFSEVPVDEESSPVGVAGTWTSLSAIHIAQPYDRERVHLSQLSPEDVQHLVFRLARMTVAETASLSGLDPARAPVILAGAVVAFEVMSRLEAASVTVSESDTLDAVAWELLHLP